MFYCPDTTLAYRARIADLEDEAEVLEAANYRQADLIEQLEDELETANERIRNLEADLAQTDALYDAATRAAYRPATHRGRRIPCIVPCSASA